MKSLSLRPMASLGLFALLLTSQQAFALGRPKPNPTPAPTPTPTTTPSPVPPPCSTAGDRVNPAEDEWVVSLKADNGKYLVAECGGDDVGIVNANRDTTGGWETFYIKELGGGEVSIRSNHGRYVAAENGGGEALHANRRALGGWERFRLEGSLGNGAKIAFKTSNGANYVTARLDLTGIPVQATAPANGPWEQFTVEVKRTPTVTARRGIVRAEHRSWVDDQGPFNPLGGTLFWSLWGWKADQERVKQNLQYLARFKFDYVRILCEVDWAGQTIDPDWPDYRENLASFMDYAYNQAGLRVELTLIGGGNGINLMELTRKVADVVADGRQHMVMNFEIANESYQRPLSLAQMRESGSYLRSRFPNHLVALSSAEGADKYGTHGDWLETVKVNLVRPDTANFVTIHMDRNPGDDGWRRVRQNWDWKGLDFPVSHNEPAGPRSSVSEEDDPVRLAMGRATGMVTGVNAWVLHNAAGVFGKPIPERNRPPNLWEVANIDAVMSAVRNVDKWMPERIGEGRHWNNGWPGNPWNVDAFWGDGDNHGVNRSYSVETAGGWVTTANGVKGYAVYTASRRSRVEIFDVILGKVAEVTLDAGQTYRVTPLSRDSGGYGAYVFVGHYQ